MQVMPNVVPTELPPGSKLPRLVDYAVDLVRRARDLAQFPEPARLRSAGGLLDQLPGVIDEAVAQDGIDRGVWWALEGTRLLAHTARVKVDAVFSAPTWQDRQVLHEALRSQLELTLDRVKNAQHLLRNPWPS